MNGLPGCFYALQAPTANESAKPDSSADLRNVLDGLQLKIIEVISAGFAKHDIAVKDTPDSARGEHEQFLKESPDAMYNVIQNGIAPVQELLDAISAMQHLADPDYGKGSNGRVPGPCRSEQHNTHMMRLVSDPFKRGAASGSKMWLQENREGTDGMFEFQVSIYLGN